MKAVAVLDRTKEPGATGEPLYLDVVTALARSWRRPSRNAAGDRRPLRPVLQGIHAGDGQGASSTSCRKAQPKNHFTVGINDDVTHTSLDYDPEFSTEDPDTVRALFYGLGADGTVGANKNSIKIIGEETDNYAQGYFVYDSKKSGSVTISHLRFGPQPIRSSYLITRANFVACHQFSFLERIDMLKRAEPGATFLLNSPYGAGRGLGPPAAHGAAADHRQEAEVLRDRRATRWPSETGMGGRINTIMQTCFFAISGVLPREEAIAAIKNAIEKTYGKRGEAVVQKNFAAVDADARPSARGRGAGAGHQHCSTCGRRCPRGAPEFVQRRARAMIIAGDGDELPVSALPVDGTFPTGTAQWEKRNIALEIPVWDEELCIQCGKCVLVCPHAVIRAKVYDAELAGRRARRRSSPSPARWQEFEGSKYTLAGRAGRLHRLRALRRGLPGQEQERSQAQGHQHGAAAAAARSGSAPTGTSS